VCDNLKKLVLDSMSELVYSDDSIIWGEDNVRKYYGTGGCVIIEIEGK
jgi:Holliday junction resolvase RusA-like endonuclease